MQEPEPEPVPPRPTCTAADPRAGTGFGACDFAAPR